MNTTPTSPSAGDHPGQIKQINGVWCKWTGGQWVPAGVTGSERSIPVTPMRQRPEDLEDLEDAAGERGLRDGSTGQG